MPAPHGHLSVFENPCTPTLRLCAGVDSMCMGQVCTVSCSGKCNKCGAIKPGAGGGRGRGRGRGGDEGDGGGGGRGRGRTAAALQGPYASNRCSACHDHLFASVARDSLRCRMCHSVRMTQEPCAARPRAQIGCVFAQGCSSRATGRVPAAATCERPCLTAASVAAPNIQSA